MNVRAFVFTFSALLAATARAGPASLLAVARPVPSVAERLEAAGVRRFGSTDNWLLLEDSPRTTLALAGLNLAVRTLPLTPGIPVFIAYVGQADLQQASLLDDGPAQVVQMDDAAAGTAAQDGVELVALPAKPYRLRTPPRYGFPRVADQDTFVQRLVDMVSADSIRARIQRLQDFRTRFSSTESCRAAEQYVYELLTSVGLDSVELDSYPRGGQTWRNPVGIKLGSRRPDKEIIIGGHMDAISEDPENLAPGAEDNGSGAAMALEAARVLAGEEFDLTLKFMNFTGEEQGLYGSQHYAQRMRAAGTDVMAMVNYDMVAWPGGRWGIRLVGQRAARRLCDFQAAMAGLYTNLDHSIQVRSFPSDSRSFEEQGYIATSGYEYGTEPYIWYHTTGDTIGNLSMELAAEVAQMAIATLATLAIAPVPPEGLIVRDVGDGSSLSATWDVNTEPDIATYELFWGTDTLTYSDSVQLGLAIEYTITGLQEGTRYFISVLARDSAGHESGFSEERDAVPTEVPAPPAGVSALPFLGGVGMSWHANTELDLAGYNLYRTTVSGSGYVRLNSALLPDTGYRDSALMPDTMYHYAVSAEDTAGNESELSAEVRGKPITLGHGILLVDETRDGNGNPGNPSDAQQDSFYHSLLEGYVYRDWDAAAQGIPLAGDFGPFSTIVWHGDDYQQQLLHEALPGLANHLAHGGRLWLSGWKPGLALVGTGTYPLDFADGTFPYEYLSVDRVEQQQVSDFIGGTGRNGYPDVVIDSTKLLPVLHGRLPFADAFRPVGATTVLTFVSWSGDTFAGKPVAVRWTDAVFRTVTCAFPVYYLYDAGARLLARRVLEDLGEPYGIMEQDPMPAFKSVLRVVRPNPAVGPARIDFELPRSTRVRLDIFDVAGRRVRRVIAGRMTAGRHSWSWDGRDDRGGEVTDGLYFVRFDVDGQSAVRPIIRTR